MRFMRAGWLFFFVFSFSVLNFAFTEEVPDDAEDFLSQLVKEASPLVEEFCELKFKSNPKVRFASSGEEWEELVREKIPHAKDYTLEVVLTLGFYIKGEHGVVLSPLFADRSYQQDEERLKELKLVLVHELVHYLDEEHFGLIAKRMASSSEYEKYMCKCLLEGHAALAEEWMAKKLGYESDDYIADRYHDASRHGAYIHGSNYLRRTMKERELSSFNDILGEDLPPYHLFMKKASPVYDAQAGEETLPAAVFIERASGSPVGKVALDYSRKLNVDLSME